MPPICESRGHVTNLRSSHDELDCDTEKSGNSASFPERTKNTIASDKTQKLAYDAKEVKSLKTKETARDDKNSQEKQNGVDYSVSRSRTSLTDHEPEKYPPKGLKFKDIDTYVNKLQEQQSELQHYLDDDEISDGHSDTKATVEAEIPTELDSVRVNEENVHEGVAKCSEDHISTSKEDNSDNEDDNPPDKDDDNPPEAANEIAASEEADVPARQMHSNCASGEDSDVPIGEANECASPVDKAKFVIDVVSTTETHVKGQIGPKYLPVVEGKNSDWLPDPTLTDVVSLNTTTNYVAQNNNLLDDLPKEEQTQESNNTSDLVVTDTNSNGATTFLTVEDVEKLQDTSIYPYFSAQAGAAGDSPMESSHENSEPQVINDDDVTSLEGSVSDNTSFKSGPADAFDA